MVQTTLRKTVSTTGIGLHSGREVRLSLRPASANTGIVLAIKSAADNGPARQLIIPSPAAVVTTELATTLGQGGLSIATVEHLLAALRSLEVDNVLVEVEGGEIPIMDGSAAPFVALVRRAGVKRLGVVRSILAVAKPIEFVNGVKWIRAEPWQGLFVDYTIDFAHSSIGRQRLALEITPQSFAAELAPARTFGFLRDVEALWRAGLALGGSPDNAVVLDENGVVNAGGLRFPDEFVRHKILDFLGDMAVLPSALWGKFTIFASGHGFNNAFAKALEAHRGEWTTTLTAPGHVIAPQVACQVRPAAI